MMRSRFDAQLDLLNTELIKLGALCENAIAGAAKSFIDSDLALVEQVSALEKQIDEKEREIEALCLKLLLQQQPVARDLRLISAALKMITDMERIGDQACDIAEITTYLSRIDERERALVADMARATIKMVTESIDAFVRRDLSLAEAVIAHDDVVDELFTRVRRTLVQSIAQNAEAALDLLMIAKYLERIGDHAVNIAEWVEFSITGAHKKEGQG